jgi:hypothetical protein
MTSQNAYQCPLCFEAKHLLVWLQLLAVAKIGIHKLSYDNLTIFLKIELS